MCPFAAINREHRSEVPSEAVGSGGQGTEFMDARFVSAGRVPGSGRAAGFAFQGRSGEVVRRSGKACDGAPASGM